MAKFAVVQAGGKQFLVRPDQEIVVESMTRDNDSIELPVLAIFDDVSNEVELGSPTLKNTIKATLMEEVKGDKIRVARFKSKVRYRKVRGFRPQVTKLKIGAI